MRVFMTAAAACGMLAATAAAEAQGVATGAFKGANGQIVKRQTVIPNRPVIADRHDHGHHHHDHHHGGHGYGGIRGGYGGAYWDGYGFPNYGYSGFNFGGPGYGFNYYNGPSNLGPLINPPIYAFGPYSSGYGYGYAPTFGYGSAWAPTAYPDPINNQLLQQQYNNDWTVLSARLADLATRNEAEPAAGTTAVPIPSTPELMIKSLRLQAQGDEAFGNQDFQRAYDRYKQAMLFAKDNGAAQFRMGYTLIALGQYSRAIEHFKRGLFVEPALAITGPAPSELYGDNNLAWSSHLAKVTQWVREDIRDHNRVFLLGVLLFFDGDTRAKEMLEKAWQLSGGRESAIVTLLNPPKIEGVKVVEPAEGDDAAAVEQGAPADPADGPSLEGDSPPEQAPAETGDTDLPVIPEPPAANAPARRPAGEVPLFPLPSERERRPAEPTAPPLPVE